MGLRVLGLKSGDIVLVHSSLKSFGWVEGGPDSVIDALLETVGKEGTVIMPTYTFLDPKDWDKYDPDKTPSLTGLITEVFRKRKGAIRSKSPPRHPFAAMGKRAKEIIQIRENETSAKNSLTYKVAEWGGYILLIGVDQNRNSTIHTTEGMAIARGIQIPYLKDLHSYRNPQGSAYEDFNKLDKPLLDAGVMKIRKIGNSECRLISSRGLFEVTYQNLKKDPCFLLSRPGRAGWKGKRY